MRFRFKIGLFFSISLALVLSLPAINLSDESARVSAWRLATQKEPDKLKALLFNGDFMKSRLSAIALHLGISTNPAAVVVGTNGWLFLGDQENSNTSAQRFGESAWDARVSLAMGQNLLEWDRWFRSQGVKGVAWLVGPDKHRVYTDHLPKWVQLDRPARIRGLLNGPARHLIADPTHALQQISTDGRPPTYYQSDTHWNMWGAAIGMDALHSTLLLQGLNLDWALSTPPTIDAIGDRAGGDLARFLHTASWTPEQEPHPSLLGAQALQSDIRELGTDRELRAGEFGQLQYPGRTVKVVTEGAANDLKVLWVRDSFGIAQSPLMAANFKETIQLHWLAAFADEAQQLVKLVQEQNPDLVIFTVVERVMPAKLFLTPPPKTD